VDWVRQKEYQKAFLETLNFRTPFFFWDSLLKAAVCGLLAKTKEGKYAWTPCSNSNPILWNTAEH
jgi:hypothetical protein